MGIYVVKMGERTWRVSLTKEHPQAELTKD